MQHTFHSLICLFTSPYRMASTREAQITEQFSFCELPLTAEPEGCSTDLTWTPGHWSGPGSDSSQENVNLAQKATEERDEVLENFNMVMTDMCSLSNREKLSPLPSRMKSSWIDATNEERKMYSEKATEACKIVCNVIAPNDGEKLFQAVQKHNGDRNLDFLMAAYKNATSKKLKTQILSLYAYEYPASKLIEMHSSFERISERQIKKARAHAKAVGPGTPVESTKKHRIYLDKAKADHFLEFANRPYFYQDVSYGTRIIKLESGEQLTMPNVIRTVTKSSLISEYQKHCAETDFSPLSRATLFRILDVREASQRKSLRGLDNTAADGASAFESLENMVNSLQQASNEAGRSWYDETRKKLRECKKYLKIDYRLHCKEVESPCPDHCRKFALSDSANKIFQESCSHEHTLVCDQCEGLTQVMSDIERAIQTCNGFYGNDQKEDLLHDFRLAKKAILAWKAHILRSENQESGKQAVLEELDDSSVLIVVDWAMKFLQLRYREKQSDWFAKRGLSWHVSSVIHRDKNQDYVIKSYVHHFDSCTQD